MESQRKRKQKDKSNGIGAHKDNANKKTKTKLKIRTMILHYEAYLINDKQKHAVCPSNPSIHPFANQPVNRVCARRLYFYKNM